MCALSPRSDQADFHFPIQELVSPSLIGDEIGRDLKTNQSLLRYLVFASLKSLKLFGAAGEWDAQGFVGQPTVGFLEDGSDHQRSTSRLDVTDGCRLFAVYYGRPIRSNFKMSAEEGVENWFAVMEPPLLRFESLQY